MLKGGRREQLAYYVTTAIQTVGFQSGGPQAQANHNFRFLFFFYFFVMIPVGGWFFDELYPELWVCSRIGVKLKHILGPKCKTWTKSPSKIDIY